MPRSRSTRLVESALRCYPQRWRSRHGDEAAEIASLLIRDGTPARSVAWSYLMGAARARLVIKLRPRLGVAVGALLLAAGSLAVPLALLSSWAPANAASVTRSGPVHPRTVRPRPVHPRPVRPRPVHSRSVHPRSVHPRSVHPRSVHPRSVHPRSVHPRSVHPRSVHARSVHARSVHPRTADLRRPASRHAGPRPSDPRHGRARRPGPLRPA